MSLSCLTCSQVLQRTDSFRELFAEQEFREARKKVDRTWSGNITAPQKEIPKGGAVANIKANHCHRRNHSTGNIPNPNGSGPKLVRSSGMRRDWSFENLTAEEQEKRLSCNRDQINS